MSTDEQEWQGTGITFLPSSDGRYIIVCPAEWSGPFPLSVIPYDVALDHLATLDRAVEALRQGAPTSYLAEFIEDLTLEFRDAMRSAWERDEDLRNAG